MILIATPFLFPHCFIYLIFVVISPLEISISSSTLHLVHRKVYMDRTTLLLGIAEEMISGPIGNALNHQFLIEACDSLPA